MTSFPLKIVTPDGLEYDGKAEEVCVRTTSGELGVLAGHLNMVAPLGMGMATIVIDGKKRYAACIGGMISVMNKEVTLVPTTFEWAEEIDVKRAEASEERAKKVLADKAAEKTEIRMAEARLKRALIRKSTATFVNN
ncbi:MAG: ATP synthase F1 subunit epsilon [Oscillospiraceae bacterium]|nr:ATP synthase F1 subunit epsilon [Oscillospiraceae bacterium]